MNIIIAGDFSPRQRVASLFEECKYSEVFDEVKSVISRQDYAIVNLETAIIDNGSYQPTVKWSPNLASSPNAIAAIKYAGFRCATLANNHFSDYGNRSVALAINTLQKSGIDYVGAGLDIKEAQEVLYKTIDNRKVAFVNFCEHEMTIASIHNSGCAPLDPIDNFKQITSARKKADVVIVIVHGGHEHYQLPSPRMKKIYHWFVELGADVVVNHHQHCFSGYELYNNKPIFYGLGNFCFDNNDGKLTKWNEGLLLQLNISDAINFELIPYVQCSEKASVSIMEGEHKKQILAKVEELNRIIADDRELAHRHKEYCKSRHSDMRMCMAPYTNRYLFSLALRKFLPSFDSLRRRLRAIDYIECESHRDVFLDYLYDSNLLANE